jgi:hypothetical protein
VSSRARSIAAWTGLFILNGFGILPWLAVKFPTVDLAEMLYQVRRIEAGYVPYLDTFTHHFLGYVLPFLVLDEWVTLTPDILKITALCFNDFSAVMLFLALRDIASERTAWFGAFLTVTVGWFWNWQGYAFNVQSYLTPLFSLALFLTVRACTHKATTAYWGAAAVTGALLTCDQRAVAFIPLLAVPPVFFPEFRVVRALGGAVLCLVLPVAVAAGCIWASGAWPQFVEATFVFPMRYRDSTMASRPLTFLLSVVKFLLLSEPVASASCLLALVLLVLRDQRHWLKAAMGAALAGAGLYATAGGHIYPNYFVILGPPMLALTSMLPGQLRTFSRWSASGAAAGVLLGALALSVPIRAISVPRLTGVVQNATIDAVADFVQRRSAPDDGVLVWGFAPQIYVLSGRIRTFRDAGLLTVAGSNFSSTASSKQRRVPAMVAEFEDYMDRTPPRILVYYNLKPAPGNLCSGMGVVQENFDFRAVSHLKPLRQHLSRSYGLEEVVEGPCDRAEIFVHN